MNDKIKIGNLKVDKTDYTNLSNEISNTISNKRKLIISYASAYTINSTYKNKDLADELNSFDIVHPDGIGVYLASKILYGSNGFKERISGSDFYPILTKLSVKNNFRVFFFGHDEKTLNLINKNYPLLSIAGLQNGYNFNGDEVVKSINAASVQILIVGLGFPKQEQWILKHKDELNCNVCIAVGAGIKVFAGTKIRGPKFMRMIGLEWFVRFLTNPLRYFNRYIIGNPLFLLRILLIKMSNLK